MARGDVQIVNPSTRWFKWSGNEGILSYYDKVAKENVEVATPFTFLLLDTFTTIKGFNEDTKEGIYSNEVKDTTKQILNVKCGKEVIASGIYKDIKADVVAAGGGYCQSCYIAFKDDNGELAIGNIAMTGSSFGGGSHKPADKNMKEIEVGAWLAFTKANSAALLTKGVIIEGKDERLCINGVVKFYAPKFKLTEVSKETDTAAIALTQILKAYMAEYFKNAVVVEGEKVVAAQVEEAVAKTYGATTTELTETEKVFLTKSEPDDLPNNFGAELPGEKEFDPFDPNNDDDLPF